MLLSYKKKGNLVVLSYLTCGYNAAIGRIITICLGGRISGRVSLPDFRIIITRILVLRSTMDILWDVVYLVGQGRALVCSSEHWKQ